MRQPAIPRYLATALVLTIAMLSSLTVTWSGKTITRLLWEC